MPSLLRGLRPTAAPFGSNHTSPSVYGSAGSKPSSEYGTFEEEEALRQLLLWVRGEEVEVSEDVLL